MDERGETRRERSDVQGNAEKTAEDPRPGGSDENHKAIRWSDGAVPRSDETLEKITKTRSDDGNRNTTDGGASDAATTSETGASDRKQEAPNRTHPHVETECCRQLERRPHEGFPVDQERRAIEDCSDGKGRWKLDGQLDEAMHAAWDPILKKYLSDPEPDWMKFEERYSSYIEEHPMRCEDITGGDVAKALRRTSSRKAAGVDGFRISELKLLPEDMIQMIAEFYNMVERTHWPEALLTALVSAIPKGAGTKPLEQRPITVTSALYRLWGCIRMEKDVMEWQEKWAHDGQYGYRKGRSTLDLSWKIALDVEHATLYGEEIAGVTTDFRKCFDLTSS